MAQGPTIHILRHPDGTAVTAQEAHDAFMNTRVLIVIGKDTYEAISMKWFDTNSKQDDPTNVGYVALNYVSPNSSSAAMFAFVSVGDQSLVPA